MNRIILMIAAWMLAAVAVAQEATVKRVEMTPNDLSGSKYARFDNNGEACALVRVEVIADNVEFFGNVIQPVEHKTGDYWVYMVGGTKMLQIKSPSFLPLMINFADYGIDALIPKMTYVITLTHSGTAAKTEDDAASEKPVYSFQKNRLYGFINNNGKIVIPPKYEWAGDFSDGMTAVKINGKYGFIDESGEFVIQPVYELGEMFREGLAPVKKDGKFGFIDKSGRFIVPAQFEYA